MSNRNITGHWKLVASCVVRADVIDCYSGIYKWYVVRAEYADFVLAPAGWSIMVAVCGKYDNRSDMFMLSWICPLISISSGACECLRLTCGLAVTVFVFVCGLALNPL